MANTKQGNTGKRSYWPFIWAILYLLNIGLILLFEFTFIHIHDRPITKESLSEISYFDNCEILDMSAELDQTGPGYVLYKDPAGVLQVVELDYNLYLPRFAIDEDNVQTVQGDGVQIAHFNRITGKTQITVENEEIIQHSSQYDDGAPSKWTYIYIGFAILLAEGAVLLLMEKRKKKA